MKWQQLFPTAGVHPYNAHANPTAEELELLREMLAREDVRAAGECGLDYSPGFPDAETQREWFKAQLALACVLRKPLFLHERLAFDDFSALLEDARAAADGYLPPAVVHCFTGTERELDEYVRQGFYIGVTGFLCKRMHGAALREMVKRVPLDRLVVETDAPYMGFPGCRALEPGDARKNKKQQYPNVPSALPRVVAVVAEALGVSPQRVGELTRANARRFLRL
jgi:TatD DNase family protein